MSGRPPFETQTLKDTYKMISKGKYTEPSHASVNARHFVKSCLQVQPTVSDTDTNSQLQLYIYI